MNPLGFELYPESEKPTRPDNRFLDWSDVFSLLVLDASCEIRTFAINSLQVDLFFT